MTKFFRSFLSLILCLCLTQFSVPRFAHSEEQGNEGKIIKAIGVKNNRAISSETILSRQVTEKYNHGKLMSLKSFFPYRRKTANGPMTRAADGWNAFPNL